MGKWYAPKEKRLLPHVAKHHEICQVEKINSSSDHLNLRLS